MITQQDHFTILSFIFNQHLNVKDTQIHTQDTIVVFLIVHIMYTHIMRVWMPKNEPETRVTQKTNRSIYNY